MANISTWSTTAASNNANPPDGAPEGMAPSAVNNTMRESMAAVRTWYEDAEWTDFGYTHTYVAATQFKIAGTDYTDEYHVGRRVRVVAATPGTIYGTITATSFSTDTTVTAAFDSGSLSNESLTVSLAALSSNSASSVPGVELSGDDWTFQGNVTAEGTLGVTGAATLSSTLAVAGNATFSGSITAATAPLPRSYLAGLGLSNDTDTDHDIAIAAGAARDGGDAADLRLSSTLTKQIDAAWSVGDDAGGMDTGTVTTSSWYAVWLIRRSDTGVTDALFSLSFSAPTMPTDYDQKRRIGAVRTDSSSNIVQFIQRGNTFTWKDPHANGLDVGNENVSTTGETLTLSYCPPDVEGILHVNVLASEQAAVLIYPTDVTEPDAVGYNANALGVPAILANGLGSTALDGAQIRVYVDSSKQVNAKALSSSTVDVQCFGWVDTRGRDD